MLETLNKLQNLFFSVLFFISIFKGHTPLLFVLDVFDHLAIEELEVFGSAVVNQETSRYQEVNKFSFGFLRWRRDGNICATKAMRGREFPKTGGDPHSIQHDFYGPCLVVERSLHERRTFSLVGATGARGVDLDRRLDLAPVKATFGRALGGGLSVLAEGKVEGKTSGVSIIVAANACGVESSTGTCDMLGRNRECT